MNTSTAPLPDPPRPSHWPVDLTRYDRSPDLNEVERAELERRMSRQPFQLISSSKLILHRLLLPLEDVFAVTHLHPHICGETLRVIAMERYYRGKTFWAWQDAEWIEIIGSSTVAFGERYGRTYQGRQWHPARREIPVIAYLLTTPTDIDPLLAPFTITSTARKIWGEEALSAQVQRLTAVLSAWGYQEKQPVKLTACIAYLLLRNRSPSLETLTDELLETVNQTCNITSVRDRLYQVSRALAALGLIRRPLPDPKAMSRPKTSETDGQIAEDWLCWCRRWRDQSPAADKGHGYYALLKLGRWLNACHPEVGSPADFTYEIALAFVAAVMEMNVGEWISQEKRARLPVDRLGQPLRPNARARFLKSVRTFFRDCQEWRWIPIHFNPSRVLQAPRSLRNLIGPDPKVVERDLWAKILWAAMNLELDDLRLTAGKALVYPLELVRALAVVWCFAALRSDEIVRLRVGCVRWQQEDVTVPETGETLPKDAICFLDIPVNKTATAYTKPVHPLVGQRIHEWEKVRPSEQPRQLDGKTSEIVPFLFSYRGMRVAKDYINRFLIPLLCRKANIPEQDSRGAITSHRARATIASMLYNAREPLDIFQLQKYLGHKQLSSTQHYLQVDPTKLANDVVKAGYLEQNLATIEVLLDQNAVMNGEAAKGGDWKFYDLGHGFCANPFWADCAHRMACARCPYYRPKESLKDQLIEGKANLVRMLEFVRLTEEEKLLVTEGIELHQELIERLASIPTPAGPTPQELDAQRRGETRVIPLERVKRAGKRQDESPHR
jgi:integrase